MTSVIATSKLLLHWNLQGHIMFLQVARVMPSCAMPPPSRDAWSSSKAAGPSVPLGRLLQTFSPPTFMKFASKWSA